MYVCDSSFFIYVHYFKSRGLECKFLFCRKFKLNGKRVALYVFIVSSLNILMYFSKIFIACDSSLAEIGRQHEWVASSISGVLLKLKSSIFRKLSSSLDASYGNCQSEWNAIEIPNRFFSFHELFTLITERVRAMKSRILHLIYIYFPEQKESMWVLIVVWITR